MPAEKSAGFLLLLAADGWNDVVLKASIYALEIGVNLCFLTGIITFLLHFSNSPVSILMRAWRSLPETRIRMRNEPRPWIEG